MSTVAEIKEAVARLPEREKIQFARWMQTQIPDCLNDDEMMEIAAEGARALDRREAHYAHDRASDAPPPLCIPIAPPNCETLPPIPAGLGDTAPSAGTSV